MTGALVSNGAQCSKLILKQHRSKAGAKPVEWNLNHKESWVMSHTLNMVKINYQFNHQWGAYTVLMCLALGHNIATMDTTIQHCVSNPSPIITEFYTLPVSQQASQI